ncbi:hypothetical protein DL762_000797 [Monosporascus cannonballus]|uniref:Thioredoxin-like fold domain-containing protein n=1 Tax=Monosporascus cannonballus TaxID=155416 RepID=A0ABY0HI97_9PEZI|nr:hypothetical protein DL762_000797 [Monosporascus cannonballus]
MAPSRDTPSPRSTPPKTKNPQAPSVGEKNANDAAAPAPIKRKPVHHHQATHTAAAPAPAPAPAHGPTTTGESTTAAVAAAAAAAAPRKSTGSAEKPTITVAAAADSLPPAAADSLPPAAPVGVGEEPIIALDFQGEVQTNNDLPSLETLRKIESYTVLDAYGRSHPFKSLYAGRNVARRVLIIFIRHFFCGNCQEYLRTLSASITPEALLQLPVSTFIAVIGCGSPKLIDSYHKETGCPFPIYADPTRRLYNKLGMVRTLSLGPKPAYMNKSMVSSVVSSVVQGLKQVKTGLVTKMGDQRQVGGEFLFEPVSMSLEPPISSPTDDAGPLDEDDASNTSASEKVEEKRVTWCHRMRTTRDHAEIPELMEVLGLEGDGATPIKDDERWGKALRSRKGTGVSMASQMSRMSLDASRSLSGSNRTSVRASMAASPRSASVRSRESLNMAIPSPPVATAAAVPNPPATTGTEAPTPPVTTTTAAPRPHAPTATAAANGGGGSDKQTSI